jgi:hypothetical protein
VSVWADLPAQTYFGSGFGDAYVATFASLYKMGISIYGGGQVLPLLTLPLTLTLT